MKKTICLMLVVVMVALAGVTFTACKGPMGKQGPQGESGQNAHAMNFDLGRVIVREQRGTQRFYRVGSEPYKGTETKGHFGTEAKDAVTVHGRTITINATNSATHVAINVGDIFGKDYLHKSRVWLSAFKSTNAAIELVQRAPGTQGEKTDNLFVYPHADTGWGAHGDLTAYFVLNVSAGNTIAAGGSAIRQVDVLHNNQISTFYIVINRAAS